jgi:hypothetical protein
MQHLIYERKERRESEKTEMDLRESVRERYRVMNVSITKRKRKKKISSEE